MLVGAGVWADFVFEARVDPGAEIFARLRRRLAHAVHDVVVELFHGEAVDDPGGRGLELDGLVKVDVETAGVTRGRELSATDEHCEEKEGSHEDSPL